MQNHQQNVYTNSMINLSLYSDDRENIIQNDLNNSFSGMTISQQISKSDYSYKKQNISQIKFCSQLKNDQYSNTSSHQNSFYSECQNIKQLDHSIISNGNSTLNDELILESKHKIQKRDLIFKTKHFKQSFIKYFIDIIYTFVKQPNDLTFSIALDRLKYYNQQTPFLDHKYNEKQSTKTKNQQTQYIQKQKTVNSKTKRIIEPYQEKNTSKNTKKLHYYYPNCNEKQNQNYSIRIQNNQQNNFNKNSLTSDSLSGEFESINQPRKSNKSNCKTNQSSTQLKIDPCSRLQSSISVQQLLKSMFYENQYKFMIHTFDYNLCHLSFLASMLYYWSKIDHRVVDIKFSTFSRLTALVNSKKNNSKKNNTTNLNSNINSQRQQRKRREKQQNQKKHNIFNILKLYVEERSQSLNVSQVNIIIVYFFLNYLKNNSNRCSEFTEENFLMNLQEQEQKKDMKVKQITELQQNLISNLKLYRRIKRMQKQFNSTESQIIFQSQLYKYQYENKLITSVQKTFQTFQLINTHNFLSSPLQKYFQIFEYQNQKKNYHLKKDCFTIWVMNIILRLCEKKSAQSLSKSSYYIIAFLAILKRFRQNQNFEGISMILPILYNIKEQLPKVWNHAESRRKQINQKLLEYSNILTSKIYKYQDIPKQCNAIISEDVIYEMCQRFSKYTNMNCQKNSYLNIPNSYQFSFFVNVQKHKKFHSQFLSHIIYHRKQILQQYSDQIQDYKKQKQIGISFNMYLLDTYVCRILKNTNNKNNWAKLIQKSKQVNQQIGYGMYIELIDYCFVGSGLKCRQLDI